MKKIQIFAIISAVITALMIYMFLNNLQKSVQSTQVDVVIAQMMIPANTNIKEEQLKVVKMPKQAINPQAARKLSDVVGRLLSVPVFPQEQLLMTKMIQQGAVEGGLSNIIPDGMRAMTIPVDNLSSLASMLRVGNRVDVFLSIEKDTGNDKKEEHTSLLLQNVKIIALGTNLKPDAKQDAFSTATIALPPQEIAKMIYATSQGKIRFVLRPQTDEKSVQVNEISPQNYDK